MVCEYVTVQDLAKDYPISECSLRVLLSRGEFEMFRLPGLVRPMRYKNTKLFRQVLTNLLKRRGYNV